MRLFAKEGAKEGPASMRPPQNAGEDAASEREQSDEQHASMRPPQNAGEDVSRPSPITTAHVVLQ